jgi:hypothetical protein
MLSNLLQIIPSSFKLFYLRTIFSSSRVAGETDVDADANAFKASFLKFSSKLSETRRVLRLFDDFPMIMYSMHYGLGDKDKVRPGKPY